MLLNPSTADATRNDPTVRRCIGYAMAWGFGELEVVNIFALRSTDPAGLRAVEDPVGPGNDRAIRRAVARADLTVAAWGNHGSHLSRSRRVRQLLSSTTNQVTALAVAQTGEPKHPLYLSASIEPKPWNPLEDPSAVAVPEPRRLR